MDQNDTEITCLAQFIDSETIQFCNGSVNDFHTALNTLFDNNIPISVAKMAQVELSIMYDGGNYHFYDECSFDYWRVPICRYIVDATTAYTL